MMTVVAYIREEVVVHVSSQLGWCGIVAGVEAETSFLYSFLTVRGNVFQVAALHAG